MPTYDVENTNDTNKGRDLLHTNYPWIVPRGTERMTGKLLYIEQYILNESKTRR